ncbi:flagellar biosynthesis protein FlhB [Candidatus Epulonipiscium fishelsonii]|uniref:Flagellar biosynthesis protein FlhB n=1 Tax=Candidatus Epulonipiscium fishelsonii TaxID=77094 RepID=A0ACC8X906_9FIRM|nr:flagellar biosynthesis protein FlhB [Epulopiscium sp. SCG-B11WGA-EpuloA1]ONI42132.1 flagellar biosynthesis protein FlhB [Epulopiscium sp. SCG-B05WGA-EpuloA1]ONI47302.1 flagellar biosynthesis protein FlhB [Epulopiscium sp. SCG-C06WGA-EpuloA1]
MEERKKAAAISYKGGMGAPEITASGQGFMAEKIIEEAKQNDVPIYQDKQLANLLTELEVGSQIPPEVYEIVAKILVFVGDMDELYARTKN